LNLIGSRIKIIIIIRKEKIKMVTPIAMKKIERAILRGEIKKIEELATLISAQNIFITDYNKKGEIIFKNIDNQNEKTN
jgi:hypothetical protein